MTRISRILSQDEHNAGALLGELTRNRCAGTHGFEQNR